MVDLTTSFSPTFRAAIAHLHQLGLPETAARASVARTVSSQAYLLAANDIFWASGWICLALIGMVWLCRRAVSGGGTHAAGDRIHHGRSVSDGVGDR